MLKTLSLAISAITALAAGAIAPPQPKFVWNASDSVPIGLYAIHRGRALRVSQLVLAFPPKPLAHDLAANGYLPEGVPLLKQVAALPGQTICRVGLQIKIDNIIYAVARERDHAGRLLPVWTGCHRVAFGDVFLLNWTNPNSLDGRYFGTIPASSIVGTATPVWTRGR